MTSTTPTSTGDDPLAAALEEAESLMESLGGADDGGSHDTDFAIDSDDEDILHNETSEDDSNLHPLHDDFLQQNATTNAATSTNGDSGIALTNPAPSMINSQPTQQQPPTNFSMMTGGTTTAAAQAVGPPSMDVFKASTSRFASNLASMAQRAATQVQTAVSTSPTAPTGRVAIELQHLVTERMDPRLSSFFSEKILHYLSAFYIVLISSSQRVSYVL